MTIFLIPRVIWKEKPSASDARKYSDLYFNQSDTSFAITPIGDLLRNFGIIGIPIGMREGFSRIIRDSVYRERLVHAGIQNVERFGPRNVAKQYENIYRKILAELRV